MNKYNEKRDVVSYVDFLNEVPGERRKGAPLAYGSLQLVQKEEGGSGHSKYMIVLKKAKNRVDF